MEKFVKTEVALMMILLDAKTIRTAHTEKPVKTETVLPDRNAQAMENVEDDA